jgi:hypothetical protein
MLGINPYRPIEGNSKEVFLFAIHKPYLGYSTYLPNEVNRLRVLARLCPFVEGSGVYTARAILHAFEPDSTYYNYCEFAKRPDRTTSERIAQEENNKFNKHEIENIEGAMDFKLIPNPNDGRFVLHCTDIGPFDIHIMDNMGRVVHRMNGMPVENQINFNLDGWAKGIYLLSIHYVKGLKTIRFSIQ